MVKGQERTNTGVVLAGALVSCLLGVIGLVMAVGAVVPAVGDLIDVETRGVGGAVGYLFGTLFFGGLGAGGLWALRKQQRRAGTPRTTAPADLADPSGSPNYVPLPEGPGMGARWAVALPLMLITTLLPVVGQLAMSAWWRVAFRESLPDFGRSRPELTFWAAFRDGITTTGYVATLPVLVLLVFLVRRTMFAAWPKTCLVLAAFALIPSSLVSAAMNEGSMLPNLALGVGLVWLNWELAKLTLWRLSRPIARDLALSELEIPYRVPDSPARLRVRRDDLRLDRLTNDAAKKSGVHRTILWADLTDVRLEHVTAPTRWQASTGTAVDVPEGPALRLTGAGEDWLLPVPEALGEDLVTAITMRAEQRRAIRKG